MIMTIALTLIIKVFISEDLTNERKELFFKTRMLKMSNKVKDTFTRDGRIIVKINDSAKWNITCKDDLEKLCKKLKCTVPKSKSEEKGPPGSHVDMDTHESSVPPVVDVKDGHDSTTGAPSKTDSLKPGASKVDPTKKLFSDVLTS